MPEPLKFCKDCAHYELHEARLPAWEIECSDPKVKRPTLSHCMRPSINLVTGDVRPGKSLCSDERSCMPPRSCGEEGLYFVRK